MDHRTPSPWRVALVAGAFALLAGCGTSGGDDGQAGSDHTGEGPPLSGEAYSDSVDDPGPTTDPDSTDPVQGPDACAPLAPIPAGAIPGKPTSVELPDPPPTEEVEVTVLVDGEGEEVTASSYVTVHYLGVSCTTGEQFDSSWDSGMAVTAALGTAVPTNTAFGVIEGWTDGLVGQVEGSLVQLDIPSGLAYGTTGAEPRIPPNDALTFVIELIDVSPTPPP